MKTREKAKNSLSAWRKVGLAWFSAAKKLAEITLLFILACAFSAQAQGIYKWVDRDGIIHYGSSPPVDGEYETISEPEEGEIKDAIESGVERQTGESPSLPPYGDAYHKEAIKRATPISVSLSRDFVMVEFEIGSSWSPFSDRLISEPETDFVREPRYSGQSRLYGKLKLGTYPDNTYHFVFDLVHGPHPLLYFDLNNNKDLADDNGPITNQGSGIFAALIRIPMVGLINEFASTGDFTMWFFTNESHWQKGYAAHYSRTQFKGEVSVNGQTYLAYVVESGINDADFTNDGIRVDLDRDGKIDSRTETIPHENVVKIDGREYYFDIDW